MTAAYVPVKGDRVRRASWNHENYMEVLYVGGQMVFGTDRSGFEFTARVEGEWIKVETPPPLPERWQSLYPDGVTVSYGNKEAADADAFAAAGVIRVHIWTGTDGVDRIERVTA